MATEAPNSQASTEPEGTPAWVKRLGIGVLVLVILFVVLQVAGVGGHDGPGRHF
jgi:hypothetical protein